jgi:hypothetical protein
MPTRAKNPKDHASFSAPSDQLPKRKSSVRSTGSSGRTSEKKRKSASTRSRTASAKKKSASGARKSASTRAQRNTRATAKRSTKASAAKRGRSTRAQSAGSASRRSNKTASRGTSRRTTTSTSSRSRGRTGRRAQERVLIDHDEIRQWVEERGGTPTCVEGTRRGDSCLLRIDFPDNPPDEKLEPVSWDDWFSVFDERNLALIVEDTTASGQISYFNKLVDRDTVMAKQTGSRTQAKATRGSNRGARTASARGQHRGEERRAA